MPDIKTPTPQTAIQDTISPDGNVLPQTPQTVVPPVTTPAETATEDVKPQTELPHSNDVQPTPKEEDNEVIDFNQFLNESGKPEKQKTVPPTTEKKDDTGETPDVTPDKTTDTTTPLQPKDKNWRDVSDVEDKELATLLVKDISKKAFDKFKPIITEHKKLKNDITAKDTELATVSKQYKELKEKGPQLPEAYYEHDHGYLLDPGFRQVHSRLEDSSLILNHWKSQQAKVAEGATEIELLDLDPKSGQYVITGKVPADAKNAAELNNYVAYSQNALANSQAEVQMYVKGFKGKVTQQQAQINETRKNLFSKLYETPENKAIYEPVVKSNLELIPPAYRNSPVAVLAAEALTFSNVIAKLLIDANAKVAELSKNSGAGNGATQPKPNPSAGPSGAEASGDGGIPKSGGKKGEDISLDDFKKEMQ